MRLIFKFGLVPDATPRSLDLRAASDTEANPIGRWFVRSFDLKNVVALLTLAGMLIAQHVDLHSRLAVIEARQQALSQRLDESRAHQQQLEQQTVSRADYEHNTTQLYFLLGTLESNQQQLSRALIEETH